MRHAINNMQSTFSGLGLINQENVFKVRRFCLWRALHPRSRCDSRLLCVFSFAQVVDQPHPLTVRQIILCCAEADIEGAIQNLRSACPG
jgi:hypothetical protein